MPYRKLISVSEKIYKNIYNVVGKMKIVVLVYVSNGLLTSQFLMARVPSKNWGSKMWVPLANVEVLMPRGYQVLYTQVLKK